MIGPDMREWREIFPILVIRVELPYYLLIEQSINFHVEITFGSRPSDLTDLARLCILETRSEAGCSCRGRVLPNR